MAARVVVVGLASDFGCQVQMTNMEDHLLDVLGTIELAYWQLASSGHMPEEFDVAVVEGAVTTNEHVELVRRVREAAGVVIAIGSCAVSGGIPGIALTDELESRVRCVYGENSSLVACGRISPMPVSAVIDVDYRVPGCPIDPLEFVAVLQRGLSGLKDRTAADAMCAACKIAENDCFYERAERRVCLGLVTRAGCNTRCISLGRPCTGCRGIAEDANLASARAIVASHGLSVEEFDSRLELYNAVSEVSAR
jgi:sulfhydrogenase subunit delta